MWRKSRTKCSFWRCKLSRWEVIFAFCVAGARLWKLLLSKVAEASHEMLVLEASPLKSCGSIARNARFGSFCFEKWRKHRTKCSFWKLLLWKVAEASHEMLVLEACSLKSWGSLAQTARFGSLFFEKLRKCRTKCLFWCLCGGVVVFLRFCGDVFVVVFLWWCGGVFVEWLSVVDKCWEGVFWWSVVEMLWRSVVETCWSVVVFLCFCGGCFCVFVWWCCGLWWCFCGGVVVFLCFCGDVCFYGDVFVVVWCCFCVFVVMFLWWCGGVSDVVSVGVVLCNTE